MPARCSLRWMRGWLRLPATLRHIRHDHSDTHSWPQMRLPRRLTRRLRHFFRLGSHARLLLLAFAVIFFHLWTSIFQTMVFTLPNFNDVLAFSLFESSFSTLLTGLYMVHTGTKHAVRSTSEANKNKTSPQYETVNVTTSTNSHPTSGNANTEAEHTPDSDVCCVNSDSGVSGEQDKTCTPPTTALPVLPEETSDKANNNNDPGKDLHSDAIRHTKWTSGVMPLFHRSQVSLKMYFIIAVLMSASLFLTNEASYIISFPVQVTLKSTKLLFTAVARRFFLVESSPSSDTGIMTHKRNASKSKKASDEEENGAIVNKNDDDGRSDEHTVHTQVDHGGCIDKEDEGVEVNVTTSHMSRSKATCACKAQHTRPLNTSVQNVQKGSSWWTKAAHSLRPGSHMRVWLRRIWHKVVHLYNITTRHYTTTTSSAHIHAEPAIHTTTASNSKREGKRRGLARFLLRLVRLQCRLTCRLLRAFLRDAEIASCTLIVLGVIIFMYAEQYERGSQMNNVDLAEGVRANPAKDRVAAVRANRTAQKHSVPTALRPSVTMALNPNTTQVIEAHKEANNSTTGNNSDCKQIVLLTTDSNYTNSSTTSSSNSSSIRSVNDPDTLRDAVEMDGDITAQRARAAARAGTTTGAQKLQDKTNATDTHNESAHIVSHRNNSTLTHSPSLMHDTTNASPLPEWDSGSTVVRGLLPLNAFLAVMCVLFSNVLDACMYVLEEKYCVSRGDEEEGNAEGAHTKSTIENKSNNLAESISLTHHDTSKNSSVVSCTHRHEVHDDPVKHTLSNTHTSEIPYTRPARASFEELLFFVNLFTALVYCVAWPIAWSPTLSPQQLTYYLTALPDTFYYTNTHTTVPTITISTKNSNVSRVLLANYSSHANISDVNASGSTEYNVKELQTRAKAVKLQDALLTRTDLDCGKNTMKGIVCRTPTPSTSVSPPSSRRGKVRRRRRKVKKPSRATATKKKTMKKMKGNDVTVTKTGTLVTPPGTRLITDSLTGIYAVDANKYANNDNDLEEWEFYEVDEFSEYFKVFVLCFLSASCGLAGTTMLLWIIAEHGSTTAVLITCVRKTITVICTYFFYDTSFSLLHFVGLVIVMSGVWWYDIVRRTLET